MELHLRSKTRTSFRKSWNRSTDGLLPKYGCSLRRRRPTICALVNADAAWLMYLRFDGDAGISTRNPDYSGAPNAVIEYRLTNGQRDEYPAGWDITTAGALRALTPFFEKKEMAPWLVWHQSS
jgi:hypothetical protein